MTAGMTVLVTGASGFLGAEVTARLITAGHSVLALLHSNGDIVRNNGRTLKPRPGTLTRLAGDITRPALGLDAEQLRLAAGADRIVHCAGITDFGRPAQIYQDINVTGTENVLALAQAHGVPLVHVSTAYVCGERDGTAREDELDVGQRFGNDYEKSKLRAEVLVRGAAADGLPVAVVRPSIVTGDRRTGRVRDYKTMYPVVRLTTSGRVRTVPGNYDALLDLVPVDYVADLIVEAATRFEDARGRTLHATGGRAVTLRDLSDVLAEYPSFQVPRWIPPAVFSADALPDSERLYHERVISLYATYMRRRIHFDNTDTVAFSHRPAPTGGSPYLRRLLDHCLRSGYLGAAARRETAAASARPEGSHRP
ncbi:SDR family oxidoreductase [Streptomyces sp. NRRL S-646]|uniref:SDR family oxidoreductase n=1 Tax=Streptomyces sp. NRRL S-646 TaxID=1463917 RepID=UPI00068EA099|nr:SDR family oxidoreductase [Streptomyces sp. NRRL S-646]